MSAHPDKPRDPRAEQQRKLAAVLERKARSQQMRRFERSGQRPVAVRLAHRTANRGH